MANLPNCLFPNSVKSFGAVGDGIADDTAAIQACIDHLNTLGGGSALVPMGVYKVTSALQLHVGIAIVGEGRNASVIAPATTLQDVFVLACATITSVNLEFRSFGISCLSAATGVTGIRLINCRWVTMIDLAFYGCEQNWYFDRGRFFQIVNCASAGIAGLEAGGCTFTSTANTEHIFNINVQNYMINTLASGLHSPALYLRRVVNSVFTQVNCNDAGTAAFIVLENDCQAVKINHSIWAGGSYGVVTRPGGAGMVPSYSSIVDTDMFYATGNDILMDAAAWTQCIGGTLASSGVAVRLNAVGWVNFAHQIVQGTDPATSPAVAYEFANGAPLVKVLGSTIDLCDTAFRFAGASRDIALFCNAVTRSNAGIEGTVTGSGNIVVDNSALTGVGTVTVSPPLPASGVATTNTTGFAIRLTITGGSFTFVTLNGISITAAGNNWSGRLIPGDTVAVHYSSVPAWCWVAE